MPISTPNIKSGSSNTSLRLDKLASCDNFSILIVVYSGNDGQNGEARVIPSIGRKAQWMIDPPRGGWVVL